MRFLETSNILQSMISGFHCVCNHAISATIHGQKLTKIFVHFEKIQFVFFCEVITWRMLLEWNGVKRTVNASSFLILPQTEPKMLVCRWRALSLSLSLSLALSLSLYIYIYYNRVLTICIYWPRFIAKSLLDACWSKSFPRSVGYWEMTWLRTYHEICCIWPG